MIDLLKEALSQALYKKRAELNYTQEAMAEKCCISARQYIDLEHGSHLPSFQTFVNITIKLGFDYETFIAQVLNQGYTPFDKSGVA